MKLIKENRQKRIIEGKEEIKFSSISSYHLIVLTARAKGEKQISESSTDDEELTLQIDDKTFPKLGSKALVDSPAAINGGGVHNLAKIAAGILSGVLSETTSGVTNFHSFTNPKDFPDWAATKETYKTKLGGIYFYELES